MKVDFQFRLYVSCDCLLLLRSEFIYFLKSLLTLFSCEWHAISSADDDVVDSSANSLGGFAIVVVEAEDAVVEAKIEP